ncbi:MAG: SCP-2 sterol transfer family protein [Acidobacteria bacterium]|nr:SCP-2 sterol transfer family protein [Acidobacteriota bacterium]
MLPVEVFAQIQGKVEANPSLVEEVGAIFQFDVAGDDGGTWSVDLKNAPGGVAQAPNEDADCVISVSQDDFVGIMTGAVDPQMAFMMGRIKVAGNFMLATKLRVLM